MEHSPAIKICGLTRAEDVRLCLSLDVDFTGFIFADKSPRRVSVEQAAALPSGNAARVGVFTGQSAEEVIRIMDLARLDFAQLHGGQSLAFCRAVGPERVIKVLWPERFASGEELRASCETFAPGCAMFLLDAGASGGGHGRSLAWETLQEFKPPRPWLLAGGLDPENASGAYDACRPMGLDVNSGVETAPGVKDGGALERLMRWKNSLSKEEKPEFAGAKQL